MSSRTVFQLTEASACDRPKHIPKGRPRGRKQQGVKYENDLAKAIPAARQGQWFRFADRNGPGCCQTDLLLETQFGLAILESKLTWTWEGHKQLDQLYIPVLRQAFRPSRSRAEGGPEAPHVFGLVVCKILTPELAMHKDWICRDLFTALARAAEGKRTVLHWLGQALLPDRPTLGPLRVSPQALPSCKPRLSAVG